MRLLTEVNRDDAPGDTIAKSRWTLTRVLLAHLAKEDKLLYPGLRKAGDQRLVGLATRLSDEMGGLAAAYSRYVSEWTVDKIHKDWTGFQAETRLVLTALRARIARENRDLYPLLKD